VRARGFTLLEVLAVIIATSVVLGVALSTYVNVSRQTRHAVEKTRETRRATAVLDAVARDLQRVVLVRKPAAVEDPLDHPWVFYAEARPGTDAADHLKFMTRGRPPRLSASAESDLEVVSYSVHAGEDQALALWRKSSPRLPESLDRRVPDDEDDGALLLADGLAEFGVSFTDDLGQESPGWDSSSLVQSGQLPVAAEIRVALAKPDDPEAEPTLYRRRVLLPVRPLDFDELLDPASAVGGGKGKDGEKDEASGKPCEEGPCAAMPVCQAVDCAANDNPSIATLLADIGGQPFCQWRPRLPTSVRQLIRNGACR
jgi:prepilin-type N-terminal cleavage/methylation domain-containing protein